MIERQRVLLAFLAGSRETPGKTQLMKWLFLLREEQPDATRGGFYEFVPYKYGPFSFQVYRDLAALETAGLLDPGSLDVATGARERVFAEVGKLPKRASTAVESVMRAYGHVGRDELLDDVYGRYPWYATRSALRPLQPRRDAPPAVYTVGYEGRSIDGLLDHLLRSGVHRLIDVRKNALSRKYGFAGKTIQRVCSDVGIEYVHVPALGIPSSMRADLSTQAAYDRLFDRYEAEILPGSAESIQHVADLCGERASALMCFEASHCQCHRGRLSVQVSQHSGLEVRHL